MVSGRFDGDLPPSSSGLPQVKNRRRGGGEKKKERRGKKTGEKLEREGGGHFIIFLQSFYCQILQSLQLEPCLLNAMGMELPVSSRW